MKKSIFQINEIIFVIIVFFAVLFFGSYCYSRWYSKEPFTKKNIPNQKGNEIVRALERYKNEAGMYPKSLKVIIGQNPIRSKWLEDPWGEEYIYKINSNGSECQLISKGKDLIFGTKDDIEYK